MRIVNLIKNEIMKKIISNSPEDLKKKVNEFTETTDYFGVYYDQTTKLKIYLVELEDFTIFLEDYFFTKNTIN
jgi:hypothetical protein